jgi:hypothetical protein
MQTPMAFPTKRLDVLGFIVRSVTVLVMGLKVASVTTYLATGFQIRLQAAHTNWLEKNARKVNCVHESWTLSTIFV